MRHRDETDLIECPYGDVARVVAGGDGGIANVHVVRVTNGGGSEPIWSENGLALFFRNKGMLYTSAFDRNRNSFEWPAELVLEGEYNVGPPGHQHYDVSPDGNKFLMIKEGAQIRPEQIRLIRNWTALLPAQDDS